ncbi:small integral membrane protein 24 [Leptodactylus fuscus]|uniref:small integral membrane protein 24 n=1 Tax=Leptodactylus fuscus TaxID=238119 RepID=UPI003F4E6D48
MTTSSTIIIALLFLVSANAEQGVRQESSNTNKSTGLQPWLIGLTATVVFLFIVFILLIVNRVWCKKKRTETNEEDNNIEQAAMNVYHNDALDEEGLEAKLKEHEAKKTKWVEGESGEPKIEEKAKVTAM